MAELVLVEIPGAVDGPVAEGAGSGEAERTGCERVLEVVTDLRYVLLVLLSNEELWLCCILILGSLLGPLFLFCLV